MGVEGFAFQVFFPVTELIVTCRNKFALFAVKGVTDEELGLAAITVCWEVQGLEAIPQEEDVPQFMYPQLRPIDFERLHCQPGPGVCHLLQSTCM